MFYTKANELNCFLPLFDIKIISSSIPDTHFHFQIKNFNCKTFKISRFNKKITIRNLFLEKLNFQLSSTLHYSNVMNITLESADFKLVMSTCVILIQKV